MTDQWDGELLDGQAARDRAAEPDAGIHQPVYVPPDVTLDPNLEALAAVASTEFGRSLLEAADADAAKTLLEVEGGVAVGPVIIRGKARTAPSGTTIAASTMPTHVQGDRLVVVVTCSGSRTRTAVPAGWDELWQQAGFMAYTKVAGAVAETFSITLSGSADQAEIHAWSFSPSVVAANSGPVADTNGDTNYSVPALTVDGSTGAVLLTAVGIQGNRGIYALAGADDGLLMAGEHYSWALYWLLSTQVALSTAINPSAETGGIANGGPATFYVARIALVGA